MGKGFAMGFANGGTMAKVRRRGEGLGGWGFGADLRRFERRLTSGFPSAVQAEPQTRLIPGRIEAARAGGISLPLLPLEQPVYGAGDLPGLTAGHRGVDDGGADLGVPQELLDVP